MNTNEPVVAVVGTDVSVVNVLAIGVVNGVVVAVVAEDPAGVAPVVAADVLTVYYVKVLIIAVLNGVLTVDVDCVTNVVGAVVLSVE